MKRWTYDPLLKKVRTKDTDKVQVAGGGALPSSGSTAPLITKDEGVTLTATTASLNFTGSGITATNSGNDVTVTVSGSGGSTAWGDITGTLASQTDLQAALDAKEDAADMATDVPANETDPVFSASEAANITSTDITHLSNLSGTNTGDQDLSGLVPITRTVNGHALSADVTVSKSDVSLGSVTNDAQLKIASNLSDVASASTARTNLGVAIGSDVEAHDADLTTIAGLTPTNDDVIQRKAGAWTNRTPAQLKTDLAVVPSDITGFDTQVRTSRLDQMAAPTSDVSINSHKLTSVTDPTSAQDAATKAYVDATAAGIDWKKSVRVATTANGTLASAYANASTVDGVTLATGDRILLKNQTTGSENGIYTVNASGAPTRATDADANAEVTGGLAVFVEEGTTNADTGWVMTNDGTVTVGTTALTFVQFTSLGQVTAGNGLAKSGSTLSIDTSITVDKTTAQALSNKDLTAGTNTFPTLNQNTTGSAATLTTSRTIGTATGDVTSAGSAFNGSANNTNAYTLATVNSNVGSFGSTTKSVSVTVNGKGLITAASEATITPAVASITGFAAGIATFLATPSSANLATAVTDETGSGALVFATSPALTTPDLGTPSAINLTNATSPPTWNQNTTGSAAKWTTARNLAGNSVDGSASVAFANKFIAQGTSDAGLSGAQFLGSLATGLVKNTTTTGVLSIAAAGTDYLTPSGNGSALTGITESQVTNLTTDLAGKAATANLQLFSSSGTWTKPTGAKVVQVICIGSGAGGGSGRLGAAASDRWGGGGGGPGGVTKSMFDASLLGASETITVGAGGAGGAAPAAGTASDGAAGGAGSPTSFGSWVTAGGGGPLGGGSAGSTAAPGFESLGTNQTDTFLSFTNILGANFFITGLGGGGAPTGNGGSGTEGKTGGMPGAGAGGGGVSSANTQRAGGAGGVGHPGAVAGGAAGAVRTNGGAATNSPSNLGGGGGAGGGGSNSTTVNAGSGSAGANYGSGGGGGGAGTSGGSATSGAGGAGASGVCLVVTFF